MFLEMKVKLSCVYIFFLFFGRLSDSLLEVCNTFVFLMNMNTRNKYANPDTNSICKQQSGPY